MGSYSNDLLDSLVIRDIWPHILKICPFRYLVRALQNLCLANKVWKQLVDQSGCWSYYLLLIVGVEHYQVL
jgi:hypothetical protein